MLLIGGVLVLIVAAAGLTGILFELSIPDISSRQSLEKQTGQPVPSSAPAVLETIIEVGGEPAPKEEKTPDKRPEARIRPAQPRLAGRSREPVQPAVSRKEHAGIGQVVLVRGNAFAIGPARRRRELELNSRIFLNEKIETGPGTRLKIKFDDESIVSQGENSVIIIDHYVYDTGRPAETRFVMRFLKGVCRVMTGMITNINPRRFKVRMRMATIGIRGCDLAFRTTFERDDIYVIELSGEKTVRIEATSDGSQIMNLLTGEELHLDNSKKMTVDVVKPGTLVSVIKGKGVEQRRMGPEDIRQITGETSQLSPASYDLFQTSNSAVFTLRPQKKTTSEIPPKEK